MTTLPDALIDVEAALERLSAAMVTGQADAVLSAEEPLAAAIRRLVTCPAPSGADRTAVYQGIRNVRLALMKCQLLGRSSAALEQALTAEPAYSATGSRVPPHFPARMESRT